MNIVKVGQILGLGLLALLVGCSDEPSKKELKNAIWEVELGQFEEDWGVFEDIEVADFVELHDIKKVDGVRGDEANYKIDVTYTIEFTRSHKDLTKILQDDESDDIYAVFASGALNYKYGEFTKGETQGRKATLRLVKADSGWRLAR